MLARPLEATLMAKDRYGREALTACPSCEMPTSETPQLLFKWRFCKICGWNEMGMDKLVMLERIA